MYSIDRYRYIEIECIEEEREILRKGKKNFVNPMGEKNGKPNRRKKSQKKKMKKKQEKIRKPT